MTTFGQIVMRVLKAEGGYVNDPDDPGGETKFGISKRSFPNEDIKNLTRDRAVELYLKHYWTPSKAERLPDKLRHQYFDMVVNMGQSRATKILQQACNSKNGKGKQISVDGRIGPKTIAATKNLEVERLKGFRTFYYAELCVKRNTLLKYYYGWYRRVHTH